MKRIRARWIWTAIISLVVSASMAQTNTKKDSLSILRTFGVTTSITNNGISFVPAFTLGKPAVIFDVVAGKRLTFEPQLRFAMTGKPWSFVFWWRYKLIQQQRFNLSVGMHPSITFKNSDIVMNNVHSHLNIGRSYLAGEISPSYKIKPNWTIGTYYMFSHGIDPGAFRTTHFLTLNSNIANIPMGKQIRLRVAPQLYYLRLDQNEGYFLTSSFTVSKKGSSFAIQSLINEPLHSHIAGGTKFNWNLSLIYGSIHNYRMTLP